MVKKEVSQPVLTLTRDPKDKDPFRKKQQLAISGEEGVKKKPNKMIHQASKGARKRLKNTSHKSTQKG